MSDTKKEKSMNFITMMEKSGKEFKTTESLDRLKEKVAKNPQVQQNLKEIFKKIEKINKNKLKAN